MAVSEGERVLAAGVLITIAGAETRLLFDFPALEVVEEEFGGLYDFTQALNGGWTARRLKALRVGLLAGGTWMENNIVTRQIRRAEIDGVLAGLVGTQDFAQQVSAAIAKIAEAFNQALPPVPKDKQSSKGLARGKGSRGAASTDEPDSKPKSDTTSSAA